MSQTKPNYKETLNLPRTGFPMRADLVTREPDRLAKWEADGLYGQITGQRKAAGAPKFVLHDGPPFANGDVHMGTALNKILKDLVLKSRTMAGAYCPYVPGWDCHGLPIEFKVVQESRSLSPVEIRTRCEEYARKYIDVQRQSFRRLGVFGDWDNPYLTLDPAYEADIVRTFAKFLDDGLVYRAKKPVLWSYGAQTALAEAEVEYLDKVSPSVFVAFALEDNPDESIVIWTTTPWTLPANLGIAVHPEFEYVRGRFTHAETGETRQLIVGKELLGQFTAKTGLTPDGDAESVRGDALVGLIARHPFLDRTSKVIPGRFVTTEAGTGAVHIAPGHGADDYVAGREHDLGLLSPVDDDGKFTDEVGLPELVGRHVFDSNDRVIEILTEKGALLAREDYAHQYPHCWRSKTPIIFRAVEQFFIRIDDLRPTALAEIDRVEWLPHWGRNRIFGTVETRPDWCISRQRTWGVPLPVFYEPGGEPVLDPALARKVADLIESGGTNLWFDKDDAWWSGELGLPEGTTRGRDTLDVWIDSGTSHVAVLDRHPELGCPADLYLEATDQHRGWFQSSLMVSVAARGHAPYKSVLTHGFVVDQDKRAKLSKSEAEKAGKPIDAAYFYEKYGADIVRLWVSSVDWENEVPFGEGLFGQTTEAYRRIRNTFRILLGNLDGFDPDKHTPASEDFTLIDRWLLERVHAVVAECRDAYARYGFRKVFNTLNNFCTTDLSALYIDITKDRLYCDAADSPRRRATQAAMYRAFEALAKLLAPVLAFTADEAWEAAGHSRSVHLEDFPEPDPAHADATASGPVAQLVRVRELANVAIDAALKASQFKKRERAAVVLHLPAGDPARPVLDAHPDEALEFLMVSSFAVQEAGAGEAAAEVEETAEPECPRCRRSLPLDGEVCGRCQSALSL